MVVIANGQFYGGGLRVAPRAIPSDGMLDVLVGEGTKRDALRALKKMPMGDHVPSKIFSVASSWGPFSTVRVRVARTSRMICARGSPDFAASQIVTITVCPVKNFRSASFVVRAFHTGGNAVTSELSVSEQSSQSYFGVTFVGLFDIPKPFEKVNMDELRNYC